MSIEWDKVESKPTKAYKVLGQDLLNIRQKIKTQEKNISELTNVRNELSAKIDSLDKFRSNLEINIDGKDAKIATLKEDVEELKASLSNKREEIAKLTEEKDAEIAKLTEQKDTGVMKMTEEKDAEITRLTETKDAEIAVIKKELTEKISQNQEEINSLSSQIEVMRKDIEGKDNSLTEKDEEINELNKKIGELNEKIEDLKEQIPKKPVYEAAEETIKGAACPKCGWTTLEDYKIVDGKRQLIRKHCPNTFCMWTSAEEPKITIALSDEGPEEIEDIVKIFKVKGTEVEEVSSLESAMAAIVADIPQNIVWIWKGSESSIFEYSEATRQAATIKNEVVKKTNTQIIRVNEGEEPENFPKLG